MIYLISREGQMCNQLLSLAAVCTLGVEHKEDVKCPVIDEKLKNFFLFSEDVGGIEITAYKSKSWMIVRDIYRAAAKILRIKCVEKYGPEKKNQYFFSRISFFEPKVFARHIEDVRCFLDFKPEVKAACAEKLADYRREGTILIGVHIRRGDYKEFQGGRWFYNDDAYIRWMKSLTEERHVTFIVCSNEKIEIEQYQKAGLQAYQVGTSPVEDLCLLSMCDYVMGPPSTYSLWAAMIGGKRRWILDDADCKISWDGGGKTPRRENFGRRRGQIAI